MIEDIFGLFLMLLCAALAYAVLLRNKPDEVDPFNLARPSIEHLEREARQAMEELRQLDRDEGP